MQARRSGCADGVARCSRYIGWGAGGDEVLTVVVAPRLSL